MKKFIIALAIGSFGSQVIAMKRPAIQEEEGAKRLKVESEAFIQAAATGDVKVVKELIKAGANVTVRNAEGYTALHLAAKNNHYAVVAELLKAGHVYEPDLFKEEKLIRLAFANAFISLLSDKNYDYKDLFSVQKHLEILSEKRHKGLLQAYLVITLQLLHRWSSNGTSWPIIFKLLEQEPPITSQMQAKYQDALNYITLRAASKGKCRVIKALINAGINVAVTSIDNISALMFAAQRGSCDVVDMLIKAEIDVNACNHVGRNALCEAIDWAFALEAEDLKGQHKKVIQLLIAAGAQFQAPKREGITQEEQVRINGMANAILKGDTVTALGLLDNGLPVNGSLMEFDYYGQGSGQCGPILLACLMDNAPLVQELLKRLGTVNFNKDIYNFDELVKLMAVNGNIQVIEVLLAWYQKVTGQPIKITEEMLYLALKRNQNELIKKYVEQTSIDILDWDFRERIVLTGQVDIVRMLVQAGQDVVGTYVFHYSVISKKLALVALLTQQAFRADLLNKSYTLNEIRDTKSSKVIYRNVDLSGLQEATPLQLAQRTGCPELVHFLQACQDKQLQAYLKNPEECAKGYMEHCQGTKSIGCNSFGQNPLIWACMFNHKALVEHMLKALPECLHTVDSYGRTALIYALHCENFDIAALLLAKYSEFNADLPAQERRVSSINRIDKESNTALVYAAAQGSMDMVKKLLASGAIPTAKAVKLAAEHGHREIALKLLALMSNELYEANGKNFASLYN